MNRAKLRKLRMELERMRRSAVKAADVESLARRLGRQVVDRGKHPMWESQFTHLFALSIPHHGNKDLPHGTKKSVLNQLEEDIAAWDEWFEQQEYGDDRDEDVSRSASDDDDAN